jgi:hypothetical protein
VDTLEIQLPEEVKNLTEGGLFDSDGLVQDDMLSKFLAYNPELVRIYGLAVADLKKKKAEMGLEVFKLEKEQERLKASIILKLDPGVYKNESLRGAKVLLDEDYGKLEDSILEIKKDLIELNYEIDKLSESYWKHKSMQSSLDSMTKLRLAERKY